MDEPTSTRPTLESTTATLPIECVTSAIPRLMMETFRQLQEENDGPEGVDQLFLSVTGLYPSVEAVTLYLDAGTVVAISDDRRPPIRQLILLLQMLERHCTTTSREMGLIS